MTRQTPAPLRRWTQADFRRERIGIVYALVDPRNRQIRYVGYTSQSMQQRLKQHIRNARHLRGKVSYRAVNWLNDLASVGAEPEIIALDTFVADRWQERERHWIDVYRKLGCDLTNTLPGGHAGNRQRGRSALVGRPLTADHRAKLSAAAQLRYADPEERRKTSAALVGKAVSEETKNKLRKHATHCPAGHEYSAANTVCYRPGVKECRACRRKRGAEVTARRRAARAAAIAQES